MRDPAHGISDDTLVFFTSDNGAPMRPDGNLPLRGYKTSTAATRTHILLPTLLFTPFPSSSGIWEGGFREPGIAWWPGRIKAGSASTALAATYAQREPNSQPPGLRARALLPAQPTPRMRRLAVLASRCRYDIFPTLMSLAGASGALPAGLVLDGVDLAPVLFGDDQTVGSGGHECIMFYKVRPPILGIDGRLADTLRVFTPPSYTTHHDHLRHLPYKGPHVAADAWKLDGLAAVRCGDHKVYWYVDGTSSTPLPAGVTTGVRTLADPLIFDLATDVAETAPLQANSSAWLAAKSAAEAARLRHLGTLTPVVNQIDLGTAHEFAICGDPRSQEKHPSLPNCTSSPANWAPPVCLVGGSIGTCIGQEPAILGRIPTQGVHPQTATSPMTARTHVPTCPPSARRSASPVASLSTAPTTR